MKLTAYDMPRLVELVRLARRRELDAIRAHVLDGTFPVTPAVQRKAAARLARYRELNAHVDIIAYERLFAEPQLVAQEQLAAGRIPTMLYDLAIKTTLIVPYESDVLWALDVDAHDAAVRTKAASAAYRHLNGSTYLVVDGERPFRHWRETAGWDEALLAASKESLGPSWNIDWHDDDGVRDALACFTAAKARGAQTPPERARTLFEVRERESLGFAVPDDELPKFATRAHERVAKQLDKLIRFYGRAAKASWQVHGYTGE